ncbi:MAG: SRPBCC family protein [Verrucomicrobiota bacterium]
MANTIYRELLFPQPPEQVWRAIADSTALAGWMYPNDFKPSIGHHFTFRVPPNPKVGFDGLIVRCEVLECEPPARLIFSWSAGGPVENTRVSFQLEPDGEGTRLRFEHSGFDVSQPWGDQAFHGAEFGWAMMFKQLGVMIAGPDDAVSTGRVLSASPREIFAAFEQPDQLARWWGPKNFTNTFELFEFKPGGRWVFVMHGPNGTNFPNESVFREIQPDARIVIEHVVKPWFKLTVTLAARGNQTHLAWVQQFESPEVAAKMRPLSETANEQVLDKLESLLAGGIS